jgi:hypothetical protein
MFDLKSFTWLPLHCTWVLSTPIYTIMVYIKVSIGIVLSAQRNRTVSKNQPCSSSLWW